MGSVVGLKNPDKIGTFCLLWKERREMLIVMFIFLFDIIVLGVSHNILVFNLKTNSELFTVYCKVTVYWIDQSCDG